MKRNKGSPDDFTLKSGSQIWEWVENPRINIRPRVNGSGGIGYRVTFPKSVTGGRVLFLQSKNLEEAKTIARSKGHEFAQSRSTALVLGDAEKIQAASALRFLKASGTPLGLDEATRRYCEANTALAAHGLDVVEAANLLSYCLATAAPTGRPLVEVVKYAVERIMPAGGRKTLGEVAAEMVQAKQAWAIQGHLRPASIRDFESRTGRISADLGSVPLPEITKETLLKWLGGLELSPRSRKNYRMVLAEVLRYAQQKRYVATNPIDELTAFEVKDIEGQTAEAREPKILTTSQSRALLAAAFAQPELDLGAAVTLGLFCGIRTEELKRLRWDAVRLNEEEPFVVIGPDIAKKRRIRNVIIPPCAVAWLQAWPKRTKDGAVTRNDHANDYQKRFKKLARLAGIEWDQNAMRHSFGSYHFAVQGNAIETARLMGHRGDDGVLFSHYRALATKTQGEEYFSTLPPTASQVIIFPKSSA
jgi:hypothetical protein